MGGAALTLAARPLPFRVATLKSVYPDLPSAVRSRLVSRLGPLGGWLAPLPLVQLRPRLGFEPGSLTPIDDLQDLNAPTSRYKSGFDECIGDNALIDDVQEIVTPMNCGWGKPEHSCIEPLPFACLA